MFPAPCRGCDKGDLLSRERRSPFEPLRERQGRFDFAPAPLTTKREGPCPSFLDYPPRSSDGAAMPRPHAVRRQTSVTRASRSKARLLDEPNRRASWRSHVHCTYIAQRVQLFKIETGNVTFLLGVQGGDSLSRKRIPPLIRGSTTGAAIPLRCAQKAKKRAVLSHSPLLMQV